MSSEYPKQIIVIDDDIETETREFFFQLQQKYGEANVLWKESPNDLKDYFKDKLNKRTVVILDYGFKNSHKTGLDCFKELQDCSSLLYIILYTARDVRTFSDDGLKEFINNRLMGLIFKTDDYPKLLQQVEKGFNEHLSRGVDAALEEWIIQLDEDERSEKILANREGKSWSLNDMLYEIRNRTPDGIEAERNIITLSLDLISRGKRTL